MSLAARSYVLVLGLAGSLGWLLGIALLPLAIWCAIELACSVVDRMARPRPAQPPATSYARIA